MAIYISSGMNWDWFADITIRADGTAKVYAESRFHRNDYSQGAATNDRLTRLARGCYHIIEPHISECMPGAPRMATGVKVNGVLHPFAEPVPRFGFKPISLEA